MFGAANGALVRQASARLGRTEPDSEGGQHIATTCTAGPSAPSWFAAAAARGSPTSGSPRPLQPPALPAAKAPKPEKLPAKSRLYT